jgi:hypothetical protein
MPSVKAGQADRTGGSAGVPTTGEINKRKKHLPYCMVHKTINSLFRLSIIKVILL